MSSGQKNISSGRDLVDFEKIPSEIVLPLQKEKYPFTVLDELNARSRLVEERTYKGKDIEPLYKEQKKRQQPYTVKYYCTCSIYKPQYCCRHTGNVIIDRDVLSKEEHLVHLATPKANHLTPSVPRTMVMYHKKKSLLPNCTARIKQLALPKPIRVQENLNRYKHVLNERSISSLAQQLIVKPAIEVTDIPTALALMQEERRLIRATLRFERKECKTYTSKIFEKQQTQIKKIICVLFEEMKHFLLNDQFVIDENTALVPVILQAIRTFADNDFHMTTNLREYQKVLAFNLSVWINKFLSNLNIHITPIQPKEDDFNLNKNNHPGINFNSFLPVGDYISCSSENGGEFCEDENHYYNEEFSGEMTEQSNNITVNSKYAPLNTDTANTGELINQ